MSITVPLADYIGDAFTEPFTLIADTLTTPALPIIIPFIVDALSQPTSPPSSSTAPSRIIFIHTFNPFSHYAHILSKHGLPQSALKNAAATKRLITVDAFNMAATAFADDDNEQRCTYYSHRVWDAVMSALSADDSVQYRILIDDVQPLLQPMSVAAQIDYIHSLVSFRSRHRLVIGVHSGTEDDAMMAALVQFASFIIQLRSIHNHQLTTTSTDQFSGSLTVARRDEIVGALYQPIAPSVHYKVTESGVTIYPKGSLVHQS